MMSEYNHYLLHFLGQNSQGSGWLIKMTACMFSYMEKLSKSSEEMLHHGSANDM